MDRERILFYGGLFGALGFILFLVVCAQLASDARYRDAGCYDVYSKPIPQYYLDHGYYLKDGWVCPT